MIKIICLLLLFFGTFIMLASIIVYKNTLKAYASVISSGKSFSKTAIFVMMIFFLMGYVATFFYIFNMHEVDMSLFLIAVIFFFGAVFCFSVVYVQSDLLKQLEHNASQLRKALDEANNANNSLQLVNNELVGTMETLKMTQDQLVFSEKMSTLGKMMAGISHEINTPLSVIRASVQSLQYSVSEHLPDMLAEVRKLSDSGFEDYNNYSNTANINTKQFTSTSALRALKREARRILSSEEGYSESILDMLSSCSLLDSATIESVKQSLGSESFEQVLSLVTRIVSINTSVDNIFISVEKVIKLTSSLKSFSHLSVNSVKTNFNVSEAIEMVLSIYTNKLKYDIEVETIFEDAGNIMGYEDELGQVWSNLIENAIYAMGEGRHMTNGERVPNILTIGVKKSGSDYIEVSLGDNGCGISAEKIKNIFEPFYTTKPVGIGSGLGLSITKQIIDKHKGTISVNSEIGRGTTFNILLPVN